MSAPVIQGWCPGALRPMMSGDGLVVRVRPHAGRLSQEQAAGIASLAGRYGNGLIDLSSRANLQIRGVREGTWEPLIDGLRALDLIDENISAETRRNIVVTPFWHEGDGTVEIASALERALVATGAPTVPGKFGFSVDSAFHPSGLSGVSADIRIAPCFGGWLVYGDTFLTGAVVETPDSAAEAAMELAHWFVSSGGIVDGRGRMARLWADVEVDVRNRRLPGRFQQRGVRFATDSGVKAGPHDLGFLVGFEFGQMEAETLSILAKCGPLRVTPWRMILIEGATSAPRIPGIITESTDPLLRVTACTGAPGCLQALIATRPLARALGISLAPDARLHVSGCSKGCAHPGAAPLTLVGEAGGTVAVVRNGPASGAPVCRGLNPDTLTLNDLTEALNAPQL